MVRIRPPSDACGIGSSVRTGLGPDLRERKAGRANELWDISVEIARRTRQHSVAKRIPVVARGRPSVQLETNSRWRQVQIPAFHSSRARLFAMSRSARICGTRRWSGVKIVPSDKENDHAPDFRISAGCAECRQRGRRSLGSVTCSIYTTSARRRQPRESRDVATVASFSVAAAHRS